MPFQSYCARFGLGNLVKVMVTQTLSNSGGSNDAFIAKYNTNGTLQWSTRIADTGGEYGYGIATDTSGNVYVTGMYSSSSPVTIFNSNGTSFGTLAISADNDVFIVKYNSSGTAQWSARIANTVSDEGYGIAVDSSGSVYITGLYTGANPATIYNSNGTSFGTLAGANVSDTSTFIVKYDTSGTAQWSARISFSGAFSAGIGIAVNNIGNVIITGYFSSTTTVYNSNGTTFGSLTQYTTSSGTEAFVVTYNATSGNVSWVARMASTAADQGRGIAADSSGNIYVTGFYAADFYIYNANGTNFGFLSTTTGNDNNAFIVKYNVSGTVQWAARIEGSGSEQGYAIAADSSSVYVTGMYSSSPASIFNSNGTSFGTLANSGGNDAFIVKYNSSGTVQWATRIASTASDTGYGIAVDSSGSVYVTGVCGSISTTVTVYNSDGTVFNSFQTALFNVFIVKYNSSGTVQWAARMEGRNSTGYGIAVDTLANVYTTGTYNTSTLTLYSG